MRCNVSYLGDAPFSSSALRSKVQISLTPGWLVHVRVHQVRGYFPGQVTHRFLRGLIPTCCRFPEVTTSGCIGVFSTRSRMSRRGETTEETSRAPVVSSSQTDAAEQRKRTTVINVVYLIAALDITWMFLQFSVTPVSISSVMSERSWDFRARHECENAHGSAYWEANVQWQYDVLAY